MIRTHNASALFDYWSQAFQFFLKKNQTGSDNFKNAFQLFFINIYHKLCNVFEHFRFIIISI